jgi:outer membrane protein, heavy metal efflux system
VFAVRIGVRAAYQQALLARERAGSARSAEQNQARIEEIARARLQAGDIGPLAARLASVDLAQATQARIQADAEAQVALLQLSVLAGLPPEQPLQLRGELSPPAALPGVAALIAQARATQPARRVALAELAEHEQRVRVATREGWAGPMFGLEFSHEDGNQNIALATVSLPLPLFTRNRGPTAQARAEQALTRAELDALEQALPQRIQALAIAADAASQRIRVHASQVLPGFQENLTLIERAFELGELDALEVSNARTRLLEAQRAALDCYRDYFDALAALQNETGSELLTEMPPRTQP